MIFMVRNEEEKCTSTLFIQEYELAKDPITFSCDVSPRDHDSFGGKPLHAHEMHGDIPTSWPARYSKPGYILWTE